MKNLIGFTLVLGTLAAPALSFAQSNAAPLTRAQVRAELTQLEQAGYNISAGEDANYPASIQAAEAKVAAGANMQQAASAVGGIASGGSSESGAPMRTPRVAASTCVGPASYCTLYFGN
jgi:type II secretory pathway pseudopilin PulG